MAENHNWTFLNIPAVAEEDIAYRTGYRDEDVYLRRDGELIDPRRMTQADLDERKDAMGSILFSAQYQQAPIPMEGNIIRREWIHRFDNHYPREWFDCVLQSWDTASEVEELNDYSVCVTLGLKNGKVFVIDVFRRKLEFPDLLHTAEDHAVEYAANIVLIEKASSGGSLYQTLKTRLHANVRTISPRGDKPMRLLNVSHMFENGTVRLPESAHWLADYEFELLGFPSTRNDDQVDATAQALGWLKGKKPESLRYGNDSRRSRPSRKRPKSRRQRRSFGRRSVPIKIFGNGGDDLL